MGDAGIPYGVLIARPVAPCGVLPFIFQISFFFQMFVYCYLIKGQSDTERDLSSTGHCSNGGWINPRLGVGNYVCVLHTGGRGSST